MKWPAIDQLDSTFGSYVFLVFEMPNTHPHIIQIQENKSGYTIVLAPLGSESNTNQIPSTTIHRGIGTVL